jgi:phosphate/phosphite/phosphonate ABC transporter binding protein
MSGKLVFGVAGRAGSPWGREPLDAFVAALARAADVPFDAFEAPTYEALATAVRDGRVHLAWLPPIPFIALERRGHVVALVTHARDGRRTFHAVLVVRAASPARGALDLRGGRAAWVDPFSASGYVVPRVELDRMGLDPRTAFASERFYRSHEAVVRAVVEREADFGATHAGLDASGEVVRGVWLDGVVASPEQVRVLAAFPEIAGDVIAARADLPGPTRARLLTALLAILRDPAGRLVCRDLFDSDALLPFMPWGYACLRDIVARASQRGLLEACRAV